MKRHSKIVLSLATIACICASCLKVPEPQYSPEIIFSQFYINPVFSGDTLVGAQDSITKLQYAEDYKSFKLDTINLGDTVWFAAAFLSFANELTSVQLDWEKDRLDLWCNLSDSLKTILNSQSDTTACKLVFKPGYNEVAFDVCFSPLTKGTTTLRLTVTSDSEFSPNYRKFYIPVKE